MRPLASFMRTDFAAARRAEDDAGLAALNGEGDVLQDGLDVEGDGDVFEDDDWVRGLRGLLGLSDVSGSEVSRHRLVTCRRCRSSRG